MSAGRPCPVRAQADARPEALAVLAAEQAWTWTAWDGLVERAAQRLLAAGGGGRPVAVVAESTLDLAALTLGTLRAGVVLAPLSPRLPPAAITDALSRLGTRTLLREDTPAPPADLTRSDGSVQPDQPILAVFTSGSTGTPKPALLSAGNVLASAEGVSEALGLAPGDRWLLNLPLHHVGGVGVVVRCAVAGATLVVPASGVPTGEALREYRVTHASLVATQLYRLLRDAPEPPPTLRAVLLGGSAIPAGLLDEAHARGWPVHTSYGLTEMASTVTMTPHRASREDLATSGLPLRHARIAIRHGEVYVVGPSRFLGYLDGEHVVEPFGDDRLFATGDLGRLDDQGRLVVMGRRDNRFISGGENVQPEAIEAALEALPGITRALVVPVEDAEYGHRPVAFIEMEAGAPNGDALRGALVERLPRFLLPVAFYPWPGGEEGVKVDRRALAAEAARRKR